MPTGLLAGCSSGLETVAPLLLRGWEQQLLKDLAGERVAVLIFRQTARWCFLRCCLCGSTEEIHMEQHTRGSHPLRQTQAVLSRSIWLGCCHRAEGKVCLVAEETICKLEGNLLLREGASSFMKSAKKFWERGVTFLLLSVIWGLRKLKLTSPKQGFYLIFS